MWTPKASKISTLWISKISTFVIVVVRNIILVEFLSHVRVLFISKIIITQDLIRVMCWLNFSENLGCISHADRNQLWLRSYLALKDYIRMLNFSSCKPFSKRPWRKPFPRLWNSKFESFDRYSDVGFSWILTLLLMNIKTATRSEKRSVTPLNYRPQWVTVITTYSTIIILGWFISKLKASNVWK